VHRLTLAGPAFVTFLLTSAATPLAALARLDSTSASFVPFDRPANRFAWHRLTAAHWTAVLEWTGDDGKAKRRVYQMVRLR
jgi:hypothetical protein